MGIKIIDNNKRAYHEYSILEKWEAGISLTGTEVKSARDGRVSLKEGWVDVDHNGECYLRDAYIAPYNFGNRMNHEERRPRKLLLKRQEIIKIAQKTQEKGLTLIPLKIYFKGQLIKLEIGSGRGKKLHDKRESAKAKDADRQMHRALRRG